MIAPSPQGFTPVIFAKDLCMKIPKPRKRGNAYRIEVMINGRRFSATRDTAAECTRWAAEKILHGVPKERRSTMTLKELIELYCEKVISKRKRAKDYNWTFKRIIADYPWLVDKQVHEVTPKDITIFRDTEHERMTATSVNHILATLSPVFSFAMRELFIIDKNPMSQVVRYQNAPPRDRRITDDEIQAILDAAEYRLGEPPRDSLQFVAWSFVFAIKTCMRRGEIWEIKKCDIFERHIHLPETKNGSSRNVPLSDEAKEMLECINVAGEYLLPRLSGGGISANWTRLVDRARIKDLHFHDSRHEAISRFVRDYQIPVESLAKITGHKDLKILLNTYYNPTTDELADLLIKKNP